MYDILETLRYLVNKEVEEILFTGNISSLDPLQVKITATDDSINVKSLTNLVNVKVGSNVLMMKFLNKFIILGVVGPVFDPSVKVVVKQASQSSTTSSSFTTDSELTMALKPNKLYRINFYLIVNNASTSPDMVVNFNNTGTVTLYGQNHFRCMSVSGTNNAAYDFGKTSTYDAFDDNIVIGLNSGHGSARASFMAKGGASGGNITLLFRQYSTDGGNPSYVRVGSFIEYYEVQEIT
jgi:hypothetical protein